MTFFFADLPGELRVNFSFVTYRKRSSMKFLEKYYPTILAFLSFLYSIFLWFTGNQLEGIYVGLWPITILGFAIAIRQRRRDAKNTQDDAE